MTVDAPARRAIAVLGAGGTLGTAIARRLAGEPATDLVLGDLDPSALPEATEAEEGTAIETMACDVSRLSDVEAVVERCLERFGRLDVLIGNAGVLSTNGRIHNLAEPEWQRAVNVNLMGAVHAVQAAVAPMRRQRSGSIVLTASVAGLTAWSHSGPYCVTKAAVVHLAKVAAVEYARDGIRVNCVCPGTFLSAMHDQLPEAALDAVAARHPLGLGTAEDLVAAYSYLAGDGSRWTTGSAMVVDGGYAAP
jgi:meso-butanediol dehydrogenase / (S,S)-butanediol dehydrogenase / diacetyl reductase